MTKLTTILGLALLLLAVCVGPPAQAADPAATSSAEAGAAAERFGVQFLARTDEFMRRIFEFEPIPLSSTRCDQMRTFAPSDGIALCSQFIGMLFTILADTEWSNDTVRYLAIHQYGHILYDRWKLPGEEDEARADEFATAIMLLSGQRKQLRHSVRYLSRVRSKTDRIAGALKGDPHWPSHERLKQMLVWIDQENETLESWQPQIMPHMSSNALRTLLKKKPAWADRTAITTELSGRGK